MFSAISAASGLNGLAQPLPECAGGETRLALARWSGDVCPMNVAELIYQKVASLPRQAVVVEALLAGGPHSIEEIEALVPGVTRRTLQRDPEVW